MVRDHGYTGSYQSVVRYLRRKHGMPRVRAIRRVEDSAGSAGAARLVRGAGSDWDPSAPELELFLGTLSYSRAKFCWPSEDQTQLSWHTGHHELFGRYEGVPLWVRIDNPKTAVTPRIDGAYGGVEPVPTRGHARMCGFGVDACRAGEGFGQGEGGACGPDAAGVVQGGVATGIGEPRGAGPVVGLTRSDAFAGSVATVRNRREARCGRL